MAKISLCMIVGNVEEYIHRCLTSFKPIADEICVVRAIGNQKPDRTLEIAEKEFGAFVGEYYNKPGHEEWPHVDDFAAARQQSFDMATGDYCFWCDSDDILKAGADKIRRHADGGGYACYIFPYDIFGKNVVVPRERMMSKDSGRWEFPVHECFKFKVEPVTAAMDDGVIIQHLPNVTKSGSNERNLTILESIPRDKRTNGLNYHLFGELMGANRTEEAVMLAVELLKEPTVGKDERYDLLLSLVIQTNDLQQRVDLLHEAHKTDPCRREALGVLACTMMDMHRPACALAYARQMSSVMKPEVQCWNSRQPFYGYTGDDIYQQALRVNGFYKEAEIVRRKALDDAGGPKISLLHATRGRPEMASKCRKAWHDLAANPETIEHIFAIDVDDKESYPLMRFNHVVAPSGGGCVGAWNVAAAHATSHVLVQLSDDWTPPPMWDKLILERIGDVTQPVVLAVSDGTRKDDLMCIAICTHAYFDNDFFMFHPRFKSVYSDNWFTDVAYARGCVKDARDIVFYHQHPAFGKAPMDETYAQQNAPERYAQGKALYDELKQGKDWSSVPGFFNYWDFYNDVVAGLNDGDTVVEVGSWFGRSIIYLAQALKRGGKKCKLFAVDSFAGELNQPSHEKIVAEHGGSIRAAFEANLKRCEVDDMVSVIEGDSAESAALFAPQSLAFCYIDAAHDYDSVKRDIAAWRPKIASGGILAGHDAQWHEVVKAVKEETKQPTIIGAVWSEVVP